MVIIFYCQGASLNPFYSLIQLSETGYNVLSHRLLKRRVLFWRDTEADITGQS